MTDAYYVALGKTLVEMMRFPQTAAAATQIDMLLKDVAQAGAAKAVIEALGSDTHSELLAICRLCWTPYAAVPEAMLQSVYQRLYDKVGCVEERRPSAVIDPGSRGAAWPPGRAAAFLAFYERMIHLQQIPSMAGPATRIQRLFERLAVAGAPASLHEELARECAAQIAAIDAVMSDASGAASNTNLQVVYELLCEKIRRHHVDFIDVIQASPKARAWARGAKPKTPNRTIAHPDASTSVVQPAMNVEQALAHFTEGTRLRPSTKLGYRCHVVGYLRWLDKKAIAIGDVTSRDIDRFLETKYAVETTRTTCLGAIRRFHEVLLDRNVLSANPADYAGRRAGTSTRRRPFKRTLRRRRRKIRNKAPDSGLSGSSIE